MCTTCRTGAMSDSTVSLCFSGVAKNAVFIQSCSPACNNDFVKLSRVTVEHFRSNASFLIDIVEQC